MPTIQINNVYGEYGDGHIRYTGTDYIRQWLAVSSIGYDGVNKDYYRCYRKFSLDSVPSGANVTKVRVKVYCDGAGGSAHLLDIHPFGGNGQPDTPGNEQTCYNRCAEGNPYVDDSPELRTTGEKWFTLGDGQNSQACIDVENAKAAVNRFTLGFHEEGDNDNRATLRTTSMGYYSVLEITYEAAPPPPAGYHYSDGLVSVQVAG